MDSVKTLPAGSRVLGLFRLPAVGPGRRPAGSLLRTCTSAPLRGRTRTAPSRGGFRSCAGAAGFGLGGVGRHSPHGWVFTGGVSTRASLRLCGQGLREQAEWGAGTLEHYPEGSLRHAGGCGGGGDQAQLSASLCPCPRRRGE